MHREVESSILIVDDVPSVRQFLKQSLHHLGTYEIHDAADAKQATRTMSFLRPDIIFLDIDLPDQQGTTLIPKFLQLSPDSTIVMFSANNTVENIVKAKELGAKGFLVKPFTLNKIDFILKKYGRKK